jgi:hypothetical protein
MNRILHTLLSRILGARLAMTSMRVVRVVDTAAYSSSVSGLE